MSLLSSAEHAQKHHHLAIYIPYIGYYHGIHDMRHGQWSAVLKKERRRERGREGERERRRERQRGREGEGEREREREEEYHGRVAC